MLWSLPLPSRVFRIDILQKHKTTWYQWMLMLYQLKYLLKMGAITNYCCGNNSQVHTKGKIARIANQTKLLLVKKTEEYKKNHAQEFSNTTATKDSQDQEEEISIQIGSFGDINKNMREFLSKGVSLSDFELQGKLGEGSYGAVYMVTLKDQPKGKNHEKYAMKCINLSEFYNRRAEENTKFEKFVLQKLEHPFLTKLRYALKDSSRAYLVMECGVGGPVDSMLAFKTSDTLKKHSRAMKFKNLGESGVSFLAANVVLGIEELHRHNIMYRDLKPENVILFEDGYAKLTDFGLSKLLMPTEVTNTEAGTVPYFAPEMVTRGYYTRAIDFWALGVFLFELATSESPFKPSQILQRSRFQNIAKKAEKDRDWKGHILSSELKDLINKLLRYEPRERLGFHGFQDIKNHPFFSKIDWSKMLKKELESPLVQIIKEFPIKVAQMQKKSLFQEERVSYLSQVDWQSSV